MGRGKNPTKLRRAARAPGASDYLQTEMRAPEWLLIEWPEGDYRDLKQDFGLGHFEGRGWCGFHHATLSIAAYRFLMG